MFKNKSKTNKDGTPDKRYKVNQEEIKPVSNEKETKYEKEDIVKITTPKQDPNELHQQLLKQNNLKLDFDVLEGTIPTKHGIIKLEKPTLVIKASYVR